MPFGCSILILDSPEYQNQGVVHQMSVPEQGLYIDLLSQCRLFYGIESNALSPLLTQLGAQRRQYAKNALLLRPEESHGRIGILL